MMRPAVTRACAAALATTIGAAAVAGPAAAEPDLLIVQEESVVTAGGCGVDEPLARASIVIKNAGESSARAVGGIVNMLAKSLVLVYVPEYPDLRGRAFELALLGPRDQESIEVVVGLGKVKEGRFTELASLAPNATPTVADRPGTPELDLDAPLALNELTTRERKAVQEALKKLGYYKGAIDGVFGGGVERAVKRFQDALDAAETGVLTIGQTLELDRRSGVYLSIGAVGFESAPRAVSETPRPEPIDGKRVYRVTLYAVVDPHNVVPESDERNNLVKFPIFVACRD